MTKDREFKDRVRRRMAKTGESYTAARTQLDTRAERGLPPVTAVHPVLRVADWAVARGHYVDWLGFRLDWDWRAGPESPTVAAISRDGLELMLVEGDEPAGGSWISVKVEDLHALAEEWNGRRAGSVSVIERGQPFDIPTVRTVDPDGNEIHWEEPVSAAELEKRQQRAEQMRDVVRARVAVGEELPAAQELVDLVGRPLGVALEVLDEFRTSHGGR